MTGAGEGAAGGRTFRSADPAGPEVFAGPAGPASCVPACCVPAARACLAGARSAKAGDGAGFVDHVDRAVGQLVVAQMARGELGGGFDRGLGVVHAVVRLVAAAEAVQDLHGLLGRRLVNRDLLQPARERPVLLDVLEVLEGRRADDAEVAGGEDRLDERRQIHRAAGRRAGADRRVDFVDEENRARLGRQRLDDGLEALFEVAAEARAGEERARVEREHLGAAQRVRDIVGEQERRRGLRPSRSCRRRRRRRRQGCSSAAGRGLRSSAAARRRGR